ncbi:MAG: 2-oxo acid dehydrogenase subunit E2 [Deltaproteobacteria bacterium]|nr:2-oxo acid dehydrogenase subunit E2 [Deltaproteobacteria bacterium]
MIEFRMPSLGADMEAGTVLEWLVKPGDEVGRGDIVAVVDTDKAVIDVEIWEQGVICRLLVREGEQVPVGTVLAQLEGKDATHEDFAPPPAPAAPEPEQASKAEDAREARTNAPATRVRSTPLARRLAREYGVDLSLLAGTGPEGAVTKSDVEQARSAGPAPVPEGGPVVSPRPTRGHVATNRDRAASMRTAIASAMARSKREIPHYYLETTIDFQKAQRWLTEANLQRAVPQRLLASVLLLKATALALGKVPELNGHWIDQAFQPSEARHLGVAISLRGGGLMAPAIRDVDSKDLDTLMETLRDLVTRTRSGKLRSSEVSEATLTVTSLGDAGVDKVYGVIYPPQVALVGFGQIVERPWAEDGMVGVRPVVTVTLAADHRVSDGIRGAKFLNELSRLLARPELL